MPALVMVAGFGVLVAGVALIYWPAALIVGGGTVAAAAVEWVR